MAIFTAVASGNWNTGAVWGNAGSVEGVDYPGGSDVGLINSNSITVTVTESTTSAYEIRRGSLTFSDGITFTYGQNCILGVETYGYQCTFIVGAGVTFAQGIYSVTTGQASILLNGTAISPIYITGSGSWLNAGFGTGENRRRYKWQYVSCQLTGDVQLTTGRGDTYPSVTEFVLSRVVLSGYNSLDLQMWSSTWDITVQYLRLDSTGPITIRRQTDNATGTNVWDNIVLDAVSETTINFSAYGLAGGKLTNTYLNNVKIELADSVAYWDYDGLFFHNTVTSGGALWVNNKNNSSLDSKNGYFECDDTLINPHILSVRSGILERTYFNIDYDLVGADDGDVVINEDNSSLTLSRCMSLKSSGLLANVGSDSGSITLDHCTARYTKTGNNFLVKFENVGTPFTSSVTVKNCLHVVDGPASDYIIGRTGSTTNAIVIDSVNNCATTHATDVIEPGQNMSATSSLNNQFSIAPGFVDDTRDVTSYGGLSYMMGVDGYNGTTKWFSDAPSGASISGLLNYMDAGFTPTNVSLQGAADDAGDIGALAVQAAPTPSAGLDIVKIDLSAVDLSQVDVSTVN